MSGLENMFDDSDPEDAIEESEPQQRRLGGRSPAAQSANDLETEEIFRQPDEMINNDDIANDDEGDEDDDEEDDDVDDEDDDEDEEDDDEENGSVCLLFPLSF